MTPDPRDALLEEKDREIERLAGRVNQLIKVMEKQAEGGAHLLPVGRRVDDPPPHDGIGAFRFRLELASRKHPVLIALTIAAFLAGFFLWLVLGNESHFRRDDQRLSALANAGLRQGVVQAGQRAQAISLLCNVNGVVLTLVSEGVKQGAATTNFIRGIETATGVKLGGRPLHRQYADQRRQLAPLKAAHCGAQRQRAVTTFHHSMTLYLKTVPPGRRDAERRTLTPEGIK